MAGLTMTVEPDIRSVGAALEGLVHQFADPWAFLRELIQNAIDAGSGSIEVRIDHDAGTGTLTIEVADSGEGMSREIIDTRLTRLFSSAKEGDYTKIGRFGIGFVSVFALDPDVVCVDTGRAGEFWRVLFRRDRSFERIRLNMPVEGTTVRVFKQVSAAEASAARAKARETLAYWCKHVRVEVRLDGELMSGPMALDGLCTVRHEEEGTALVMAVVPTRAALRGYYHGGLTLHESHDESLRYVAFKIDSRFLEHSLTRDNVIRDEHFTKAMVIVERVARTRLMSALFERIERVVAGEAIDPTGWAVLLGWASVCVAGQPDPQWLARAVVPMIEGAPRSLAQLRSRARGRRVYVATEMSPVCARLLADGHIVVRAAAGDGMAALVEAATGEAAIDASLLCTALAIAEDEADAWAPLTEALLRLLKLGKWKVPAVMVGRLEYPGSMVAGRVAISQAQFGELTAVADCGVLVSGWLASGRVLVLAAEHATLVHLRGVAVREPELAAYLTLKLFFLHGELTTEQGAELASLAAEARWATDALIEALRADGQVDSRGRFTLDRDKAREKLQKFQLADPHRYVLELVQAAVLRGATNIEISIDADDMHMRFDGAAFTAEELDDVWGSIFADGEERMLRGVRALALGLNAALGTGPKRIVVRSGSQELRLAPRTEDVHRQLETIVGTTIHVVQRVRLNWLGLFLKDMLGELVEEAHLKRCCVYAWPTITLDGVRISSGMVVAGALGVHEFSGPGLRGLVAVTRSEAPAELRLIKDGVWLDSRPLKNCGRGVLAIVEGDALRKDVSLAKIVADEALAAVETAVAAARWSAMARVLEQALSIDGRGSGHEKIVRAEVLRFMVLSEMPAGRDRQILGEGLTWFDARTANVERRQFKALTLLDLAAAVVPGLGQVRAALVYADDVYRLIEPQGPPIPFVDEGERAGLGRVLGCQMVLDDRLARLARRAECRKIFLTRGMALTLPASRPYAARGTFEGDGLTGQIGLTEAAANGVGLATGESLWLLREGCLLTVAKIEWGISGLEVAASGEFEPNDEHDDAVRNKAVVNLGLRVVAGLQPVLAELVRSPMFGFQPGVRWLVKQWLQLVFDAEARSGLWQRLGVLQPLWPDEATVRAVLPQAEGLARALWDLELFEDFDGARRSLAGLSQRMVEKGWLDEIDRSVARVGGIGAEVLWLGRGDRAIVGGLFGAEALRSWQARLDELERERQFMGQARASMTAVTRRLCAPIVKYGSESWCRTIERDGVRGVVVLARHKSVSMDAKELQRGEIELYIEERKISTRTMELGVGPIVGAASHLKLRANRRWDGVAEDEALALVTAVVRAEAWTLLYAVVGAVADPERWVVRLVLRLLVAADRTEVTAHLSELSERPLLTTIAGELASLATIEATIAERGHVTWVAMKTPDAAITDPPVLRELPAVIDALKELLGAKKVVEGDVRVMQLGASAALQSLPEVTEAALDPASVWDVESLAGGSPRFDGEMGLSRGRTGGGLTLTLCTLGRRVETIVDESFEIACEAIVSDPQLPLTVNATVDRHNKRYGQYLKRCRRAVYGLVVKLCEEFEALAEAEQGRARALLLAFVVAERKEGEVRREQRQSAWDAVCRLALLRDVYGRPWTLAEVEAATKRRGVVEVVRTGVAAPVGCESVERMILRVDEAALACVSGYGRVVPLDARWDEVCAALKEMAAAPMFELPDVREVAWIERKGTLAGGLQGHLWAPKVVDAGTCVVFTQGGRIVGELQVFEGVGCAGVVSGEGLEVTTEGVVLTDRQQVSLAKHVCLLIGSLVQQVKGSGDQFKNSAERAKAKSWLVDVAVALESADASLVKSLGAAFETMQTGLAELVGPAMRAAREQAQAEARARAEAEAKARAEADAVVEPVVEVVKVEVVEVVKATVVLTPEHALLAVVRAELEWARQRHGTLLEQLQLERLAIGDGGAGIVTFEQGLVLQRRHPLVARQLVRLGAGQAVDAIEVVFIVSAVYSLMNAVAEEIVESDERAFVARVAEGLALALA